MPHASTAYDEGQDDGVRGLPIDLNRYTDEDDQQLYAHGYADAFHDVLEAMTSRLLNPRLAARAQAEVM